MRARTRDRTVYLASHPFLFVLLAATRHRPVLRLGGTVLVHDREAFTAALTGLPLNRTAAGTTGGAVSALTTAGALFDQQGTAHRQARRTTADPLSTAGVAALRPLWTRMMADGLRPLAGGNSVDLVPLAAELAGATALALLAADNKAPCPSGPTGGALAAAARAAASAAAREHMPGPFRGRAHKPGPFRGRAHKPGPFRGRARAAARETAANLTALVAPSGGDRSGLYAMLSVATVNTTVAALPRAAAWAADDDLWDAAAADPQVLADELLRVIAPTPLLPRAAAADGSLPPGCPVHAGDRLMLITRHATDAHRSDPDPASPAPPQIARLVFGVGPHACPGAHLARAQMADWLTALAPYHPVVTRARPDRRSALPGWRSLVIRARAR